MVEARIYGLFGGGNGDGLLGPSGRRSEECCEVDREWRGGDSRALVGVTVSCRGVVERWLFESLDARDAGRTG
jgi:hypothetical protein